MSFQLAFENSDGRRFSDAHRKPIPKPRTAYMERIVPSLTLRTRYGKSSGIRRGVNKQQNQLRLFGGIVQYGLNFA